MDVTPNTPSKRTRAKVVAKAPVPAKPTRKTRSAAPKKQTTPAAVNSAPQTAAPLDLHSEIQKAAFYLAAERQFAPGHELDDWLKAERRITALRSI